MGYEVLGSRGFDGKPGAVSRSAGAWLRFFAKAYPNATNTQAAVVLARSPPATLDNLHSNQVWNLEVPYSAHKIKVLGLFPPGDYLFSEDKPMPTPVAAARKFRAGEHGWETSGSRSSFFAPMQYHRRHHTLSPTLYIRGFESTGADQLAVRIRDDQGRVWNTRLEPGFSAGICACLLELPPEVKSIIAEVVMLTPVQAEFLVDTSAFASK